MEKRDEIPEKASEIGNPLYCAYIDGIYLYKDPKTNNEFVWDEAAKKWLPKTVSGGGSDVRFDGENYTYTDRDGTVFEWDSGKGAWFPKGKEEEADLRTCRESSALLESTEPVSPNSPTIPISSTSPAGFHNPNYDNSLQSQQATSGAPRRFYYAALSPSEMGVNEPVLFLSPDDQVNNNSTITQDLADLAPISPSHPVTPHTPQQPSSSPQLPLGWERHDDANGPYYWHIKSGTIQRDLPTSQQSVPPSSNPALLIPGSLQSSATTTTFRRSQTISSQLSSVIPNNNSTSCANNGGNTTNSTNNANTAEKRKSWSQFLDNNDQQSVTSQSQSSIHGHQYIGGYHEKSSLRFVAVSLGCLSISEEDLTPERSSRAVSKVIAELTNPGAKGGCGGQGMEVAGKIWGGGSELYLELDDSHLRVKAKDRSLTVAEQPIHSIRVWGVGRDDPRDFAYVAREKQTRQFLCHVFRLEMNARPLASALRDACKKIMIERQQKQKRPTTLPTGLRKTVTTTSNPSATFFPTPMDEPRKILRAYYLGAKHVNRPTGMDVLNTAIDVLRANEPVAVSVSVAPSVLMITSEESDTPKLDEEFLVRYQLSYGVNVNNAGSSTTADSNPATAVPSSYNLPSSQENDLTSNPLKRKMPPAQPQPPQWFDLEDAQNTKVYVSNLPEDITDEEFVGFMSKCGLIMKDPTSGQFKIKLYEDSQGRRKGDGLCSYIKIESVQLALQILDGSDLRGSTVKVEKAKFTLKGQYDPTKKPKSKKKKDKEKLKKQQESLFAWKPEKLRGERPKHERVVVVKNAFSPQDFEEDVSLILEYKQDFRDEAAKFGNCKKVVIFDNHPNGIMQIFMSNPEEADAVVTSFNNRFFGGKMLEACLWDGESKFHIEETDAERAQRLERWEKFIAEDDKNANAKAATKVTDEELARVEESMVSCPTTPPRLADS